MQATINPLLYPELFFYAASVTLMLVLAGIASIPPRQEVRTLVGAAVIFSSWVMTLFIVKTTNSLSPSGIQTTLDIVTAGCFFFVSLPSTDEISGKINKNDWASYVCFIYLAMILVNLTHLTFADTASLVTAKTFLYVGFVCIVSFGVVRGFGIVTAAYTLLAVVVAILSGTFLYNLTMNILFTLAVAIVIFHSSRVSHDNFKSWTKHDQSPPRRRHKTPSKKSNT